ncbi:hypothetical protein ACLKA6_011109 [Drosophila palustris]
MEAVCRICMDNSVALVDIFEERPSTTEKPSLADMLNECAGCKVKQDDPLPKQICDTCVLDCLNAFRFKRTSQQSQERFMELLNEKKAHLHTHPQCRPFKCSQCTKTFSRQLQAKEHILAHKGIRPYQCEKCNKPFKSLAGYRGHVCRDNLRYPN